MDYFKVARPILHLSHAPAKQVKTSLDNRTSKVGSDPVIKQVRGVIKWQNVYMRGWVARSLQAQLLGDVQNEVPYQKIAEELQKAGFEHMYQQCRDK